MRYICWPFSLEESNARLQRGHLWDCSVLSEVEIVEGQRETENNKLHTCPHQDALKAKLVRACRDNRPVEEGL